MDDTTLMEVIETRKADLTSKEEPILDLTLRDLESLISHDMKDDSIVRKSLWIQLVAFGYRLNNEKLCLIAIEKLALYDLLFALRAFVSSTDVMLQLVAEYFHLNDDENARAGPQVSHRSKFSRSDSATLSESTDDDSIRHDPARRVIVCDQAQDHEIDENFETALTDHESIESQYEHLIRLVMKHLMGSAFHVLSEYCKSIRLLQNVWFEYLIACGCYREATHFSQLNNDGPSSIKGLRLSNTLGQGQRNDPLSYPEQISEFLLSGPDKWTSKKHLDLTRSVGMSLAMERKMLIAECAMHHLEHHDISLALSSAFCINESDFLIGDYLSHFSHKLTIDGVSRSCAPLLATSMVLQSTRRFTRVANSESYERVNSACSVLGLLGEIVRLSSTDGERVEQCLSQVLQHIEMVADSNLKDKLDSIDPILAKESLVVLLQTLKFENNKDLNTNTIVFMLHAIRIFLIKLKTTATLPDSQYLTNLECMFDSLSTYLEELPFGASDSLVRASNNLVIIVKDKLDALADSDSIRQSFRKLVETVAGCCLVEARYKSAAILYSQVGDSVNAVKSLMRTGEVQPVFEYALLVRDITVNRITINFMRHLRVDPDIIEDFLARSRL